MSWLLPLPAFSLAAFLIFLSMTINKNISLTMKNMLFVIKENAFIIALLSIAVLFQYYSMISVHDESSMTFLSGILMGGGITTYDKFFYVFICLGFLASLFLANKSSKRNIQLILSLVLSLALYCTYIFVIQLLYMTKNEYFYFKTLDILTVISVPFCITGFGIIIEKITEVGNNLATSFAISIIIMASLVQLLGLEVSTLSFARGYRAFSSQIDHSMLDELNSNVSQLNFNNKRYSLYYVPDTNFYFQNEVANMMAKSNSPDSNCFTSMRHSIWKTPPIDELLNVVIQECSGYHFNIITNKPSVNSFEAAVNRMGLSNIVTIKSY